MLCTFDSILMQAVRVWISVILGLTKKLQLVKLQHEINNERINNVQNSVWELSDRSAWVNPENLLFIY